MAAKTLTASRDAALDAAEDVTRREGATGVADALHTARTATGALHADELPVPDYDELTVPDAVAAVKDLTDPARPAGRDRLRTDPQEPARRRLRRPDPPGRHRQGGHRHQLTDTRPARRPHPDRR